MDHSARKVCLGGKIDKSIPAVSSQYYSCKLRACPLRDELSLMDSQPIPSATWDDVARIVHSEYPASKIEDVCSVLKEYKKEASSESEPSPRVVLAALKLAHGNIERLKLHLKAAALDHRDVLMAAQYPEYVKEGFRVQELPNRRRKTQIIVTDWQQYKKWLKRKLDVNKPASSAEQKPPTWNR